MKRPGRASVSRPREGGPPSRRAGLEGRRHLDEQDALAALAGGERERRPDDALAHAALAGEDHEPAREERVEQHPGRD